MKKKPTITEVAQGFATLSGHVLMVRRPKLFLEPDVQNERARSAYWQNITKPFSEIAPLIGLKQEHSNWDWRANG